MRHVTEPSLPAGSQTVCIGIVEGQSQECSNQGMDEGYQSGQRKQAGSKHSEGPQFGVKAEPLTVEQIDCASLAV